MTVTVVSVTVETGNLQPVPDDLVGMPVYLSAPDQAASERRIGLSEEAPDFLALVRPRRYDLLGRSRRFRANGVLSLSGMATGGR